MLQAWLFMAGNLFIAKKIKIFYSKIAENCCATMLPLPRWILPVSLVRNQPLTTGTSKHWPIELTNLTHENNSITMN